MADRTDSDFPDAGGYPDDIELRRALAGLAGDPAADVEAVMSALPDVGAPGVPDPSPGPLTRLAPWVGLATAAGLLVGYLAARLTEAPPAERPDGPGDEQVASGERDAPGRLVMRRGKVFIETDDGPRALDVGDAVAADEFFVTEKGEGEWGPMWANTALLSLPDEVEVRILGGTKMTLGGPRSLTLVRGQVCVVVPDSAGSFHVVTNDGDVSAQGATFQIAASENEVVVVSLDGTARFEDLTGTGRDLPGRRVLRVVDGMVEDAEAVDLVWSYAAWQAQMLYLCSERREEALGRALELVEGLADPRLASRCERALRGAGMLGEEALMVGLSEVAPQRETLRRRAALLLSEIGSLMSIPYHLGMLTEEDPDLRVAGFRAFERTTGIDTGLEAGFWREASPSERFGAVQKLRELARQY